MPCAEIRVLLWGFSQELMEKLKACLLQEGLERQRVDEENPYPHSPRFFPEEAYARVMQRLSPSGCLGRAVQSRGIILTARSLPSSTASITLLQAKGPASSASSSPARGLKRPSHTRGTMTRAHSANSTCQRDQSAPKQGSFSSGAKFSAEPPVCSQAVDSSSLAPHLQPACSTAGVCQRKMGNILSAHTKHSIGRVNTAGPEAHRLTGTNWQAWHI